MKKFIKNFAVYLTVAMLLMSCLFMFPTGAIAAEDESVIAETEDYVPKDGWYLLARPHSQFSIDGYFAHFISVFGGSSFRDLTPDQFFVYAIPDYVCFEQLSTTQTPDSSGRYNLRALDVFGFSPYSDFYQLGSPVTLTPIGWLYCEFDGPVSPDAYTWLTEECTYWDPDQAAADEITNAGLYHSAYDLLSGFLYGQDAEIDGWQQLFLTCLTSIVMIVMFALPFLVVWFFIRMFSCWR